MQGGQKPSEKTMCFTFAKNKSFPLLSSQVIIWKSFFSCESQKPVFFFPLVLLIAAVTKVPIGKSSPIDRMQGLVVENAWMCFLSIVSFIPCAACLTMMSLTRLWCIPSPFLNMNYIRSKNRLRV